MKVNVGGTDRTIRFIAGIVAIGLGIYFKSWWGAVGVIPLLTAFMSFCPVYTIFGFSSCGSSSCKTN